MAWADYQVSCDVYVDGPGSVMVLGRLGSMKRSVEPPAGIWLEVSTTGLWQLYAGNKIIARGDTDFAQRKWHRLKLEFKDVNIGVFINGQKVHTARDKEFKTGLAGIGSGYNHAEFDNFKIAVP